MTAFGVEHSSITGPNVATGHASVIFSQEAQVSQVWSGSAVV